MYLNRPGRLEGGDCFNIPLKSVGNIEGALLVGDRVSFAAVELFLCLVEDDEEDDRFFSFTHFFATLYKKKMNINSYGRPPLCKTHNQQNFYQWIRLIKSAELFCNLIEIPTIS